MHVKTGNHSSVPFIKLGKCRIGTKCACKHTEKAGGEPKKWRILQWSPKRWISSEQGIKITSENFFAGGDLLRSVSAIPIKFIPQRNLEECREEVPTVTLHRTVCERTREERSHLGNYTTRRTKQSATRNLFAKKVGSCGCVTALHHTTTTNRRVHVRNATRKPQPRTQELALWCSHHPAWMRASHGSWSTPTVHPCLVRQGGCG